MLKMSSIATYEEENSPSKHGRPAPTYCGLDSSEYSAGTVLCITLLYIFGEKIPE